MSDRAWTHCTRCGALVTKPAEHEAVHEAGTERAEAAWTEACKAREEIRAAVAEVRALAEEMRTIATTAQEALTVAEQNRSAVAALRANNPAPPDKPGRA